MAADYLYSVWFADDSVPAGDQDAEWVACIMITAESPDDALAWGDHLAGSLCTRRPEIRFVSSSVDVDLDGMGDVNKLPSIRCGELVGDDVIGW